MISILALCFATLSLAVSIWSVWLCLTRWPASGFVKVSPEYAQKRHQKAARRDSLAADRTITRDRDTNETFQSSRVRKARMRKR